MKKIHILMISLLFAGMLSAQSAFNIMQTAREKTKISGLETISTLIIRDAKQRERIRKTAMASKAYSGEIEKRIIRFIEPADVRGMGMLIIDHDVQDDDMWVYIPANRQSRRIVSSEKSKSFMGSEFSNADMSPPNLHDFHYQLLGDDMINNQACWKIEIRPINTQKEDEYGFLRKITWINKVDNIMMKSEYYDFDNELHKTLNVLAYKEMDPINHKFIITNMKINNFQNGRSSDMLMNQVQLNQQVPDKYFTVAYLERP
ncbi:MAG: outer membrane lipoprotein-sorting protein [Candidatus Marinimicrobia bacterium]|nr:outer membrane lipoprotein-sorting protein [Candidatus Neomarinimicrobiota bacterium]